MVTSRRALVLVSPARALVELAQDVPKPPVHFFEHGDMLIRRPPMQAAQPGHGIVDPLITCLYLPGGAVFPGGRPPGIPPITGGLPAPPCPPGPPITGGSPGPP